MTSHDRITRTASAHGADFKLLAQIKRHAELFDLLGGDVDEADGALVAEMCALELIIAATPAHTREGLDGKELVIERADFGKEAMEVVEEILRLDDERVAA